jgi:hypothetical protein
MICELVVDAFGALSVRATEEVCRVGGFQRRWVWVDARALMVGLIGAARGRTTISATASGKSAGETLADDDSLWVRGTVAADRGGVRSVFRAGGGAPPLNRMPVGFELRTTNRDQAYVAARMASDPSALRVLT